jgi:hypothetical protein
MTKLIGRLGAAQSLAVTAALAVVANAFSASTTKVAVSCTAACNIAIGKAPIASASSTLLPAGELVVLLANAGEKIAAITATTATLSVTELDNA